jgi:hypothetical protein
MDGWMDGSDLLEVKDTRFPIEFLDAKRLNYCPCVFEN